MCASGSSIDQERERERDVESYVYLLFQLQAGGDMFLMTNFHASCVRPVHRSIKREREREMLRVMFICCFSSRLGETCF